MVIRGRYFIFALHKNEKKHEPKRQQKALFCNTFFRTTMKVACWLSR